MNLFIGCSSSLDIDDKYLNIAYDVASLATKYSNTLVFGTYSKSMMGECYNVFKNKNIIAVSLEYYKEDYPNMPGLNIHTVTNNFDRLKFIYDSSDVLLILPGGTGTYSELFGIIEELKTNKRNKKLILFNYEGFYDKLIDFLKININKGFILDSDMENINIVNTIEELEECLK
jgi:uncharacterized protein (TIGR00730 family)